MSSDTNIKHLARLANLPLTEDELTEFAEQIPEILGHVDRIQELELSDVAETSQVTSKTNEFREDVVEPSFSQREALSQTDNTYNGYFLVPAVISQENSS